MQLSCLNNDPFLMLNNAYKYTEHKIGKYTVCYFECLTIISVSLSYV